MKLDIEETTLLLTKKDTKSQQFGLANQSLLIGMYRDKIYKNIYRIVPQEYMSNARDANIENGKKDIPIEVTLPSLVDPVLKIRDFGIGIDEDRIQIFSQYGESTKRGSNDETGGFGIGCKCAWTYTESFNIETVFELNGSKVKRIYSLYITNKVDPGNYRLVSESIVDSDTETGTTILIPIMESDIGIISKSVYAVCEFWEVKPNIIGRFIGPKSDYTRKDGYIIYEKVDVYSITSKLFAVIGGICYNVDKGLLLSGKSQYEDINGSTEEVKYLVPNDNSEIFGFNVALEFNTGEVDISTDRENLDYTIKTIAAFRDKISKIYAKLKDKLDLYVQNHSIQEIVKYYCSLDMRIPYTHKIDDKVVRLDKLLKDIDSTDNLIVSRKTKEITKKSIIDVINEKYVMVGYKDINSAVEKRRFSDELFNFFNCDYFIFISRKWGGVDKYDLNQFVTHDRIVFKPKVPKPKIIVDSNFPTIDINDIKPDTIFIKKNRATYTIVYNGEVKEMSYKEIRIVLPKSKFNIYALSKTNEDLLRKQKIKYTLVDNLFVRELNKLGDNYKFSYSQYSLNKDLYFFLKKFKDDLLESAVIKNNTLVRLAIKLYLKYYPIIDANRDYCYNTKMLLRQFGTIKSINLDFIEKKIISSDLMKLREIFRYNSDDTKKSINLKQETFIRNVIRTYHE